MFVGLSINVKEPGLRKQCVLQGFTAGRADAEPAQDEAAQVQKSTAAAALLAIKQKENMAADIAACAPAKDWLASVFTHAIPDVDKPAEHAGDFSHRHSASLMPSS